MSFALIHPSIYRGYNLMKHPFNSINQVKFLSRTHTHARSIYFGGVFFCFFRLRDRDIQARWDETMPNFSPHPRNSYHFLEGFSFHKLRGWQFNSTLKMASDCESDFGSDSDVRLMNFVVWPFYSLNTHYLRYRSVWIVEKRTHTQRQPSN